jgi:hypothetical protein
VALKTPKWISQIADSYKFTKPIDPSITWVLPLTFVGTFAAIFAIGTALGSGALGIVLKFTAIIWAIMLTMLVFGKKAEKAAYASVEGVPGAAAQVLTTLRGGWFTTPAVEINKNQEIVHRLVGRPGVVLIIEAKPGSQIAQVARQKAARWVGDTPITEIWVGRGEGQVPMPKLTSRVRKLPKVLRPAEVTELRRKLDAAAGGSLPIPKGPMPKGMRVPRR